MDKKSPIITIYSKRGNLKYRYDKLNKIWKLVTVGGKHFKDYNNRFDVEFYIGLEKKRTLGGILGLRLRDIPMLCS